MDCAGIIVNEIAATFGHYGQTEQVPRSWLAAALTSTMVYAGLGMAAVLLATATTQVMAPEPAVDLTFVEKVVKPEPPPAPAPVVVAPPPAAAPVVPKNMKVRKLDTPPPPKALTVPKEMPKEAAPEADPSQDKGVAVYGEPGQGDPAGLEGGSVGGVAGGQAGAIALPEDAEPPLPSKTNAPPSYPQQARALGKTGTVVLKVIILADGRVADVEVLRGDEPFVSAAVQTVKGWRYEPARYKGQPIAVYRIIQIPFKLNA